MSEPQEKGCLTCGEAKPDGTCDYFVSNCHHYEMWCPIDSSNVRYNEQAWTEQQREAKCAGCAVFADNARLRELLQETNVAIHCIERHIDEVCGEISDWRDHYHEQIKAALGGEHSG